MSDNSQKNKLEGAKKVLAAVMTPVTAVSGAVAAPSPEVRGILNDGSPAIHRSLPTQKPATGIAKEVNSILEAWADAKGRANEQSERIEGANSAKNALKGVSSTPVPKDTGKAMNALKGNSNGTAQKGTSSSNSQSNGGQGR